MKFGIFFLLITAFALKGSAQKIMMLNESLKANSEQLLLKHGGFMLNFYFGIYITTGLKKINYPLLDDATEK